MQKSKIILIIFFPVFILLCVGGVFLSKKLSTIPPNPAGTIGNTAGNLQNNGLFCESDGIVYFSNPYDDHTLYQMGSDESQIKKVGTSIVKYINAGEKHLYYYQYDSSASNEYGFVSNIGGLYRCEKKNGKSRTMKKTPIGNLLLVDDLVYYLNYDNEEGYTLYSIDTNKNDDHQILEGITDPTCYADGKLYYCYQTSEDNHYLYCYNLASKSENLFLNKDVWYPQISGNYLYYLDIHNNYTLCRCDLATQTEEQLTTERIDCYNVTGNLIYYQVNSKEAPYLGMMQSDGSSAQILAYGNYTNINVTSRYVYFNTFGEDLSLYHAPIGTTAVSKFTGCKDAVVQK